jgi:hypothetical protein
MAKEFVKNYKLRYTNLQIEEYILNVPSAKKGFIYCCIGDSNGNVHTVNQEDGQCEINKVIKFGPQQKVISYRVHVLAKDSMHAVKIAKDKIRDYRIQGDK